MSATELLAGAGGSIKLVDEQILTASGNWNKVAAVKPTDRVIVDMWSGGGGGALSGNGAECTGGQGGNFARLKFFGFELPSTVPCVVGAGGAAVAAAGIGNDGGASSFGSIILPGGAGGVIDTSTSFPIMQKRIRQFFLPTSVFPNPLDTVSGVPTPFGAFPNQLVEVESGGYWTFKYDGSSYYLLVADRLYAGAAGGSTDRYQAIQPPGKSLMGGAGGLSIASGSSGNGAIPGGGGGCKHSSLGGGFSGAGARGEIRVRVLRGAS